MVTTKWFNKFFYAVTIVAFMIKLIAPTPVYADDGVPPTDPAPVSDPADPTAPDAVDAPALDPAVLPDLPQGTDVVVLDENGAPLPLASEAAAEEVTPLLADVPPGTEVVVLDENGAPLPLASEAAAVVIAQGDPVWCPVGSTPGASDCTESYASLTALLAAANEANWVDGVIWIEDGAISDVAAVSINGAANTHSLTLNGGWTGGSTLNAAAPSTFVVPITIFWGGQLTINNLTLDGTTAGNVEAMLVINSTAADPNASTSAVTLSNVTVTNSQGTTGTVDADAEVSFATGEAGYGAKITTTVGGVKVSDSAFSYNNHSGLTITSAGPVTLNTVTAHGNGGQRDLTSAESDAVEAAHHAGMLWDSVDNRWVGINLDNLDANGKVIDYKTYYQHVWWGSGVDVLASTGNVLVWNSQFGLNTNAERNNDNGLIVEATSGDITLNGVTANGNFNTGADLTANAGTIQVTDSYFLNTREYSNSVRVDGPGCTGPDDLCGWEDGNYYDYPSDPSNPDNSDATTADWYWGVAGYGGTGLSAQGSSDITLTRVSAATAGDGNDVFGAQLFSWGGDIAITDSEFTANSYTGLYANSGSKWVGDQEISGCYDVSTGNAFNGGCDITLTNVTADDNGAYGAELYAEAGGITVQKNANGSSVFTLNDGTGLYAKAGTYGDGCPAGAVCDVTLTDVSLLENGDSGAEVGTYNGDLTITNMTATDNGGSGLYFEQGDGYDGLFSGSLIMTTGTNTFRFNGGNGLETSMDNGNVTISGGTFNDNSNGLNIYIGAGDVTLTGGTFDQNDSNGVDITIDAGDVSLTGGTFSGNSNNGLETSMSNGNVTISGGTFDQNDSNGVYIDNGTGNVTLTNVTAGIYDAANYNNDRYDGSLVATGNQDLGVQVYVDAGTVQVTGGSFTGNKYSGMWLQTDYGDVNISGVDVSHNLDWDDDGAAHLQTNNGGSINIIGTNTFNYNGYIDSDGYENGLALEASAGDYGCDAGYNCDITMGTGTTVSHNVDAGAKLYNNYYGNISVTGGVFSDNDGSGLRVYTGNAGSDCPAGNCNITLSGVTSTNNGYSGAALVSFFGSTTVTNSIFTGNFTGLTIDTGYDGKCVSGSGCGITLNGVTANDNYNWGGLFFIDTDAGSDSPVEINSSSFNTNHNGGLLLGGDWGDTTDGILPTFTLTNVTANGNTGDGVQFVGPLDEFGYPTTGENAAANIVICGGSYSNNDKAGANIGNFGGKTTFGGGVVSTGNGGENYFNPEFSDDCVVAAADIREKIIVPIPMYNVASSQPVTYTCPAGGGGFGLRLPKEDNVSVLCSSLGGGGGFLEVTSDIESLGQEQLPAQIAGQFKFVSGMKVTLSVELTGPMNVSFKVPADMLTGNFSILFWDGSQWIDLGGSINAMGFFATQSDKAGVFVFVTK